MTNKETLPEEEFSFFEFVGILLAHARWVVGIPLGCALVAFLASLLVARQWQASVVVQVGQVGHVGTTGPSSQVLEPILRAAERIKLRPFQDVVLEELGIPLDEKNPKASLYRRSLKVRALLGTDVFEIRVRGYSRDEAERMAAATVKHLRDVHAELAASTIKRLGQQLAELQEEIGTIRAQQDELMSRAKAKTKAGTGFAERVLFDNMLQQLLLQRRDLEQRRLAYEEQLGPLRTYATAALDKVYVDEKPAVPRTLLYVVVASLVGLCLGVFVALVLNAMEARAGRALREVANPAA